MKKRLIIFTFCLIILISGIAKFIISSSVPVLSESELTVLKSGKMFWTWPSAYGPLSVHYIEHGSGENHILFLHGFRAHTYTWKLLIEPLTRAGYHVWAIDLIGFGLSDKPNHVLYSQSFFIEQIAAFMQAKEIHSTHVIGNSMGGELILELAVEQPECVRSITLINALGYSIELPYYIYVARYLDFIWGPFLTPSMIRNCLNEIIINKSCITDEKVEAYAFPYRFPGGTSSSLLTMRHFDLKRLETLHHRFAEIKKPVLIIWGEHDTLLPLAHYERFLNDFPHADRLLIPQCGHIPQEEKPEEVLSAIIPFIQKEAFLNTLEKPDQESSNNNLLFKN